MSLVNTGQKDILYIYTRVSTIAQAESGTSLETQTELGIKRANELGFDYKVYNEGGKSSDSDSLINRPVLLSIFDDIIKGNIKHVYVYDHSRISRNDMVSSTFRIKCKEHKVTLYTHDGKYNFANPTDKLIQQVLAAIAQFDNSLRAERSRLGKFNRVKSGSWHGGPPPYGYKLENKKLVVNDIEAKWVKYIFKHYNESKSPAKIKQELEQNCVATRRGNLIWTLGSIQAILNNTHYVGYYTYTDSVTNESLNVSCPSIISHTLWDSVKTKQTRSKSRIAQQSATKHFYLLRDIMFCGHCNKAIRGMINANKNEYYYYCGYKQELWRLKGKSETPWKHGLTCGLERSLSIKHTDNLIWNTVIKVHGNSSLLRNEFKKIVDNDIALTNEEIVSKQAEFNLKIKKATKDRTTLTKTLANLNVKRVLKLIDNDLYTETKKRIEDEIVKINDSISQSKINIKQIANTNKVRSWFTKYFTDIKNKKNLSDEEKKQYLQGLIDKIIVTYDANTKTHNLKICFQHAIVDDAFEFVDAENKELGYKIFEGKREMDIVVSKSDVKSVSSLDNISKKKTMKQ